MSAQWLGPTVCGIKVNGFSTLLPLLYDQVVGLPADLVGLAIMVALVLDAFIDPVIGHLSDQTKSRWGRRQSCTFAAAIPFGLSMNMQWNLPTGVAMARWRA